MQPVPSARAAAMQANVLLLPLPGMKEGAVYAPDCPEGVTVDGEVLAALAPGAMVITGTANDFLRKAARDHALEVLEYEHDHAGRVASAAAIAEGAVARIVLATDITLNDATIVVLGFGVIASQLAVRLHALGAHVHVIARSHDARSLAREAGLFAHSRLEDVDLARVQLLVNTVPAKLVAGEQLAAIAKSCTLFDLSSPPEDKNRRPWRLSACLRSPGF